MPILHNPTEFGLHCHVLGRLLAPGERVEISEEIAKQINGLVFRVEGAARKVASEVEKPVAKRQAAKRGAQSAEVTAAPERETR